ncbi:hypothetical protein [Goekera deserti]|uniref:hypothetical protein n=1 Tax=Goekera deserti TaxID=2497753 RepID=UPI001877EE12|nr:hypothetical protein [Goekera deserti]
MWWIWALVAWSVVGVGLALVVGPFLRGARLAAETAADRADGPRPTAPAAVRSRRTPRRRIPVPAFAIVLGLIGVGLEAVGFLLAAVGLDTGVGRVLAMDAPLSLPRMYVASLFAAAAVAAAVGAARAPHRRAWWLAVGAVAAVIAVVKGGGTVHTRVLAALGGYEHKLAGGLVSGAVAAAVIVGLFWLSRTERRDRRRVLGSLGLYAGAAVGLSTLSSLVGPAWGVAATFVEESGESLAGVTVLVAVLAGVAPRLVLPTDWALRRLADVEAVDLDAALAVEADRSGVPTARADGGPEAPVG